MTRPTRQLQLIGRSRPPAPQPRALPKANWLDRLIAAVSPAWGVKRLQARATAFAYEAAGHGRRTSSWARSGSDANAAAAGSLVALRELSRDLHRNNGWARRGVSVIANNTVGWGIQPRPTNVRGPRAKAAADLWKAWSTSTSCDYDGRLPFTGLQKLVMQTVVLSGEALIVRRRAGPDDGLPVPLRLQVLEPDYFSPLNDGVITETGGIIVQGIEFDKRGHRVAYWLYNRHPGSGLAAMVTGKGGFAAERIPVADVIHVYNVERPGQFRGVPWLASAIARLQDFDEFEDAELMKQKVAACFAAFVVNVEGSAPTIGEPDEEDDRFETLEPALISYLDPGEDVRFAQPATVTEGGFSQRNLRRIAASLGVTYEDLTGDYSQSNFSSARMARLAHWANVHDWQWNMLIPQLCDGAWRWVMELAEALEGWQVVPGADWVPPPMPMLEPDKEGLSYQRLVRSGAMTLPQMIRELGYDPETHLQEIADTNATLDRLKIVLDSDPRHTTGTGQVQGAAGPKPAAGAAAADDAADTTDAAAKPNGKAPRAEA